MKQRIVLHVGLSKTGTTSIQRFLSQNREGLAAQSVLYPDVSRMGPVDPRLSPSVLKPRGGREPNHVALALEIRKPNGDQSAQDSGTPLWSAVFRQIEQTRADTTIISYENFHARPDTYSFNLLATHLNKLNVHGVIYLRPLEDWMTSLYSQDIKGTERQSLDFSRYMAAHRSSSQYSYMIDSIFRHIPLDSFSIGDFYIPTNGDLIGDFLDRSGVAVDLNTGNTPAVTSNASLPSWATLFLLRCNRRRLSDEAFVETRNALSRSVRLQRRPSLRPGLDVATPDERLKLHDMEVADTDRLWERHGVRLSRMSREPIAYRMFDDEDFRSIRGIIESRLSPTARSELGRAEGAVDDLTRQRRR